METILTAFTLLMMMFFLTAIIFTCIEEQIEHKIFLRYTGK